MIYETIMGDTFDSIAFKIFKNEKYAKEIINENKKYLNTIVFNAGIKLNIPTIEYVKRNIVPPWRE